VFVIADTLTTTDMAVAGAVSGGDRSWLEARARALAEAGADALDLNASSLDAAEEAVLLWMAEIVEAAVDLPLSLDSPELEIVCRAAERRRSAPILNSWSLDRPIDDALLGSLERDGSRVVVQLRDGDRLPADAADRHRWAEGSRKAWEEHGIGADRLLFDAVALPWGTDLEAGRGLLEFVASTTAGQPECVTLVGLGNVGYGHPSPVEAQRRWLEVLVEAGLGAVLLDPIQPALRGLWRS